ncbi:lectin receptor kinase [Lasius niger]|uniref:Lectin receptor kinase n=1 Tax=Lasius niger TaxID=67767 RepID=A0A0J7K8G5_LASNI|nr:lectin receptor kinase [Lasius niger]
MLIAKNLPGFLWAEAVKTAAYVLNRTIAKQLDGMTAYKKWFKHKPMIKHMRVFGSDAYKNVPKEKRKKMDPKSEKMILVGYEGESTNY